MKIIASIVLVSILFLVYILSRKPIIKIPAINLGGAVHFTPLEYYKLEATFATTQTGRDLLISDHTLYIIRGKSDIGVRLSLYDGDCILVDEKIKEVSNTYKAYLVEEYPMFSARKGVIILPRPDVKPDDRIIGAIVSKIPADYMQKYRRKQI